MAADREKNNLTGIGSVGKGTVGKTIQNTLNEIACMRVVGKMYACQYSFGKYASKLCLEEQRSGYPYLVWVQFASKEHKTMRGIQEGVQGKEVWPWLSDLGSISRLFRPDMWRRHS